ncbi:unnamed protein product, partial [Ixodes persulcatus]
MQQITVSLSQDHDVRKTPMNMCDSLSPVDGKPKPPLNADCVLSNELLETLRRECLERKVMARLSRRPIMIDTKRLPTKDEGNHESTYKQVKLELPNCNYVLSENYENLSGDESQAARSFDTNEVDHKAIAPFLPLVDAMEKRDSEEEKKLAEDAEDDFPEEGSLVIDDGSTAPSGPPARRWNRRPSAPVCKSPDERLPTTGAVSQQEASPPVRRTACREIAGDVEGGVREEVKVTEVAVKEAVKERKRLLLRDSKTKKISPAVVRRASSCTERRADCDAERAVGSSAEAPKKRGRRKLSRQLVKSSSEETVDKRVAPTGAGDPTDDSTVRNGQRKRGRWKSSPPADSDKASEEGSDSNNTVDYQLSSDDEAGKPNRPSGADDVTSGKSG